MRRLLAGVLAVLGLSAPALAQEPLTATYKGTELVIWLPVTDQKSADKVPLILFSHGYGGCARQSVFLTAALAKQGYMVVAPEHQDANCGSTNGGRNMQRLTWFVNKINLKPPQQRFDAPLKWDDKTYDDRRQDMVNALDYVLNTPALATRIDPSKVGAMGHSLGGYTVLGLGGAHAAWHEPRIKAIIALAPYTDPYLVQQKMADVSVPVMYQVGTRDKWVTPYVVGRDGAYARTRDPKMLVTFDQAGHFAWTELVATYHQPIITYSVAYFDQLFKGHNAVMLTEQGALAGTTVKNTKDRW